MRVDAGFRAGGPWNPCRTGSAPPGASGPVPDQDPRARGPGHVHRHPGIPAPAAPSRDPARGAVRTRPAIRHPPRVPARRAVPRPPRDPARRAIRPAIEPVPATIQHAVPSRARRAIRPAAPSAPTTHRLRTEAGLLEAVGHAAAYSPGSTRDRHARLTPVGTAPV
ncbi:hypothetical protein GCM10010271_30340 [Streptomyces kurssanovii]|nr:hypothetical protein GCM10010271_30340 [Streptomyces kurssanovii]